MDFKRIVEKLIESFPQLPQPKYWDKHGIRRFYFNKKEENTDYTFFIDIPSENNFIIRQKANALWHPDFPSRQEISDFLSQYKDKKKEKIFSIQNGICSEFYQVNPEKLGTLNCYELKVVGGTLNVIGGKLAYKLRKKFSGFWNFSDYLLLSDNSIEETQLNSFIEELWSEEAETYKNLTEVKFLKDKIPSAKSLADFTANFLRLHYKNDINHILDKYKEQEAKIKIKKECIIRGWSIKNSPTISISIKSNLYYGDTFEKFLTTIENEEDIINFPAIDIELEHRGTITGILGPLKGHRKRLLNITKRQKIKQIILEAPDDEQVLIIDEEYHYIASSLYPLVTTKNAYFFKADPSKLMGHLTLSPELRNSIEDEIVSLFKEYISKNYNSIDFPDQFKKAEDIGFKNLLKFKDDSIHSEDEYVLNNLKKHGIYKLASKFEKDNSLKIILILGTLFDNYQDFWQKLTRELTELRFAPKLAKKVEIKEIDIIEIEKKIKDFPEEEYDIVIAILPEKPNQDKNYEIVKSSLFRSNIVQSQFIFRNTIQDKLQWAIANVILGILSKTENIPYILAKPLEFADFFVGIDISREKKKKLSGSQNYAATARFYGKDGTFLHYEIQEDKIEGETVPKTILEKIFAKTMFQGKTIMIHRDGYFRGQEIPVLKEIGKKYNIVFQCVEVIKENAPRLYKVSNYQYLNPNKNQIFYLNQKEAIIINNEVKGAKTVKPLRIRARDTNTKLNDAIISVMALRMMHFGTTKPTKLPVTIIFSDRISGFVRRGIRPPNKSGKIPWWY